MSRAIGIDLGTTKSVMAVMEGGEPTVITTSEGSLVLPSYVAVSNTGELLVGQIAKRQSIINPDNTIYSIKRFVGRKWGEPAGRELTVEEDAKRKIYKVTRGHNNEVRVVMGGKEYSPEQISSMILQKLKQDAEAYMGEKISDAIITVPANFNDAQRQATKDAGTIAGLNVMRIISEPTAAALAYGLDKKGERTVAVYHFGGGSFDISVLEMGEGTFQVKSTAGDTHLGGDDIDQKIMDWLITEFKRDQKIYLSKDRMALQRLREAAEKAKIDLSTVMQTDINLPFITADASGPKHMNITLTRSKLEQIVMELVDKTLEPCRKALSDAGITAAQLDEVILVGSSTRMPLVQQKVKDFFGREPGRGINPEEAVARGAAIQAAVLQGEVKGVMLLDVIPLTLGIETLGSVATPLIPRNTTIPTSKSHIFSTSADNQTSVEIHVLQGERPMAADNITLGRFILDGILPAPRGMPQIEVTFDIDANGILSVRAQDKGTGREQKITITSSGNLSKQDIEKIRKGAEARAAEDIKRKEVTETWDRADTMAYQAEEILRADKEKIPQILYTEVEGKITTVHNALKGSNLDALKRATQELSESLQKIETWKRADTMAYQAEEILRNDKGAIPTKLHIEIEGKVDAVRNGLEDSNLDGLKQAMKELLETLKKIGAAEHSKDNSEKPAPKKKRFFGLF